MAFEGHIPGHGLAGTLEATASAARSLERGVAAHPIPTTLASAGGRRYGNGSACASGGAGDEDAGSIGGIGVGDTGTKASLGVGEDLHGKTAGGLACITVPTSALCTSPGS